MNRTDLRNQWNANAAAWTDLSRDGFDLYRDWVNTPAFFELLPEIDGLTCLDLGCGEGHNTRLLADRGAHVIGLDISDRFIEAAAGRPRPNVRFIVGDGAVLPFRDEGFDAVTAFMSLMDVAEPERTLVEAARVVRRGGFIQFSVLHPVGNTPIRHWVKDAAGRREALAIGDYFYEGPLTDVWTFSDAPAERRAGHEPFTITYARRTLAGWINSVIAAGLMIEAVAEPAASEAVATTHPEVADTRIAPYFLVVRARKP